MDNSYDDCMMQKSFMRPDGGGNAMKCLEAMLKQVLSGKVSPYVHALDR